MIEKEKKGLEGWERSSVGRAKHAQALGVWFPTLDKPDIVYTCDSSTGAVEAGGLGVQGHLTVSSRLAWATW